MLPGMGRDELLVSQARAARARAFGYHLRGLRDFRAHTVLDTLVDLTAVSVDHSSLPPRDFMLARLAALIAVDAPPASYVANADAARKAG